MKAENLSKSDTSREPCDELTRLSSIGRAQLEKLRKEDNGLSHRASVSLFSVFRSFLQTYLNTSDTRYRLPFTQRQCSLRRCEPPLGQVAKLLVGEL